MVPEVDVLSFEPTRQVDVLHEHVARLGTFPFTRVRATTTPTAEIARLSSRSRGSSPQRGSNIGHLRQKRQRFDVHAAAQQSCRYNFLRAPASSFEAVEANCSASRKSARVYSARRVGQGGARSSRSGPSHRPMARAVQLRDARGCRRSGTRRL